MGTSERPHRNRPPRSRLDSQGQPRGEGEGDYCHLGDRPDVVPDNLYDTSVRGVYSSVSVNENEANTSLLDNIYNELKQV